MTWTAGGPASCTRRCGGSGASWPTGGVAQVTVLLNALGDSPDAVQASRTRHWQLVGDDRPFNLVEDHLASRLVHRDRHALLYVDVFAWACNVGGTWIATPSAIRRYLRRARAHEQLLRTASSRQPRRGVRVLPDGGGDRLLPAATSR